MAKDDTQTAPAKGSVLFACAAALVCGIGLSAAFFTIGLPAAIDRTITLSVTRAQQEARTAAQVAPPPRIDFFTFAMSPDQKISMTFALQEFQKAIGRINDKVRASGDFKLSNPDIALLGSAITFLPKRESESLTAFLQDQVNAQIKEAQAKADKEAAAKK